MANHDHTALRLFTQYHDGDLLDVELISQLSELSYDTLGALPDGNTKDRVLRLKTQVEGQLCLFGGITTNEIDLRASQGSPAAQAMAVTLEEG